jgi:Holliday junction resolvase
LAERDHVEESLHYLMVNVLIDSLEREGFEVRADHVGGLRDRPSPIGNYVPDIEATMGAEVQLIEVETQNTLGTRRAREQLAKLTSAQRGKAFLAVPFDCLEQATELREDMEVDFEILPCYPFVRYVGMPK